MNSVELSKLGTKVEFNIGFFSVKQVRGKREKGVRYVRGQLATVNALFAKNLVANGIVKYVK